MSKFLISQLILNNHNQYYENTRKGAPTTVYHINRDAGEPRAQAKG